MSDQVTPAPTTTVQGTVATTQSDTLGTGTISATDALAPAPGGAGVLIATAPTANSFVALAVPGGGSQCDIQILGTATGTYYFEDSMDSTNGSDGNWIATNYRQTGIVNTVLGYSATTNGVYRGNPAGFKYVRVRNVGGTAPNNAITIRITNGGGTVFQNASTPAGTNVIGHVINDAGSTTAISAANLVQSTTAAAAAAVTCTLPAAGAGLFHYITRINIIKYATVATVGGVTPIVVTTTNLPGSLAWTTPTAQAVGTNYETDIQSTSPIKSSAANVATTVVCPATTSIIWRVNVYYYTAA